MTNFNLYPDWMSESECANGGYDPEWWFSEYYDEYQMAKKICSTCPVRKTCAEYVQTLDLPVGIWAGVRYGGHQFSEKHGTYKGIRYHYANREAPCEECWYVYLKNRRKQNGLKVFSQPDFPAVVIEESEPKFRAGFCGSEAGYLKHWREYERACELCDPFAVSRVGV